MAKGTLHLNVEFSAVTDEEGKFGRLATLLGMADADHALGRCMHLWLACTRRGEAELPQWLVEQLLGERGPEALVEAELASWAGGRGDSKTRRLRIGGAEKHCLWMVNDQAAKHEQSSKGGKTRASTASRAGGRFTSASPAEAPAQTSPSEIPSASEISDPDALAPAGARDPAVPGTAVAPVPAAHLTPAARDLADQKRRLIGRVWQLAGEAFRRVQAAGIDPEAPDGWAGLPAASASPMRELLKIVDGLLVGERPDFAAAEAKIANRILVAEAEARASDPPTARWMTPARMWWPQSFAVAADMSPEQAAKPIARGNRAGPRSSAERATRPRDIRVGSVQPSDPSLYPDGEQEIP